MQLTEAQRMVYNTAKRFAEREIKPYVRQRQNDEQFPLDVMRKMADIGLLGGPFPEKYGGAGIDNVSYVLTCEAIGGVSPSVFTAALTVQLSLVSTAIYAFGSEEQRQRWLPELLSGRLVGAFALSEPNVGSDPAAMELSAQRNEGGWVLNGAKFWISNGSLADIIVVFAQTDPGARHKGIGAFVVDGDSPGLERRPIREKLGLQASDTAALFFDGVHVGNDRLLGAPGDGFKIAQTSLESGRTSTAACAVGIIQTCLDACIAYAGSAGSGVRRSAATSSYRRWWPTWRRTARLPASLPSRPRAPATRASRPPRPSSWPSISPRKRPCAPPAPLSPSTAGSATWPSIRSRGCCVTLSASACTRALRRYRNSYWGASCSASQLSESASAAA